MNNEIFMEAMNEISDKHIAQAVNYEVKTKAVKRKSLLPFAACLILVAVSLLLIVKTNILPTENTTQATTLQSQGETVVATEISDENEDTTDDTEICVTFMTWEQKPYPSCYKQLYLNGECYVPYNSALIGEEKLLNIISQVSLTANDDNGIQHTVTADAFEIEGVETKLFVALLFKDGVQKDYSAHGYYVYINEEYTPQTLDAIIEQFNFENHLVLSQDVYYDAYTDDRSANRYFLVDKEISDLFTTALQNSKDSLTEQCESYSSVAKEHITFSARHIGNYIRFILNVDGYLYVSIGSKIWGYNIGTQCFDSVKALLEEKYDADNSEDVVVNYTASTTQQGESYAFTVQQKKDEG